MLFRSVSQSRYIAVGTIGLPMNQLGQELRAVLDGTIDANARIGKVLSLNNSQLADWKVQGILFDELMKKLKPFSDAGDALGKTWTGAMSNFQDAVELALGTSTKKAFDDGTNMFQRLQSAIVSIDEKSNTYTFNNNITSALRDVSDAISDVINKFSKDELSTMMSSFVRVVGEAVIAATNFVSVIGNVASVLGPLAPMISSVVSNVVIWGGAIS